MNTFDINYLDNYPVIGYDTETTGLVYPKDRAFAVAIGLPDNNTYALDLRGDQEEVTKFRRALANYKGRIVCHNASFDYRMSVNAGVKMDINSLDDTAIRACCYDENLLAYDLDTLCFIYLDERKEDIYGELASVFGGLATRNVQMKNISKAPWEIVGKYIRKDAWLTLQLWMWQEDHAKEGSTDVIPDLHKIWDFERSLIPRFVRMEMKGIRVDLEEAHKAMGRVDRLVKEYQEEVNSLFGKELNTNSTKQVRELLEPYQVDGDWYVDGVKIPSTEKGAPSLGAKALREINNQASNLILNIRSGIKTRDTFLGGHVIGHAVNGRVYPTINQSKGETGGTRTGRLSYQNPAMQQIPSRNKEVAQTIKPIFLPEEGELWLDADENSFEVRVFAHLVSKWDERIIKVYKKDPYTDFHQWVAELTGLVRNATYNGQPNAKQLNLCVDGSTEYLSKNGWRRIEDYAGEEIAQWNTDGTIEFVKPSHHHSGYSDDMYSIKSKWGELVCTGDHRLPVLSPAGGNYNLVERKVRDMAKVPKRSFSLATAWVSPLGMGCDLSDDEIRLAVAWQADGCLGTSVSWTFRRQRKIDRICSILESANLDYSLSNNTGGTRIGVLRGHDGKTGHCGESYTWPWMIKDYKSSCLSKMDVRQMHLFLDELVHWDGSPASGKSTIYVSKIKDNADFVQLVCNSLGYNSSMTLRNGSWSVRIKITNRRSVMSYNIIKTSPSNVYCFTVPSSWWVARRDNAIHITGNSAIFNSGDGAIAEQMGMQWEWDAFDAMGDDGTIETIRYKRPGAEAANIIAQYHAQLPGVKILQRLCKQTAISRGFIYTKRGRRINFPNKKFAYKASGLLIQTTAADFNKENVAIIDDYCEQNGGRLLLNTHDSYSLSVPGDEGMRVEYWNELKAKLEEKDRASIPLIMDLSGTGSNWWNALTNRQSENQFPKHREVSIHGYKR